MPFKGLKMDTPGAEDGRVDGSGGLERVLYSLRLSTRCVNARHSESTVNHSRGPAPE